MATSQETLLELYRGMALIRGVEEELVRLFEAGEVPGFIHLSIGQEAVAVGVCSQLGTADTVASNHRGHGHALAKGVDLDCFFAEIMGRDSGICRGRGGSMHVADRSVGMLGANGIVGAGLPIAVGSAIALQLQDQSAVAVAFFGDGALAEGSLHESLNLAALWKLPLLAVCENNGWGEFTPTDKQFKADLADLATAFSIPHSEVDGNDVVTVGEATRKALDSIRHGDGPQVLECRTTRVRGHFEGDPQRYRDEDEIAGLAERDPLARTASLLSPTDIEAIHRDVALRVERAVANARAAAPGDFPAALQDVYA
jgi:pyruvate dehydrogenase E1 component alpha subunit